MDAIELKELPRQYKNSGQHAEQVACYTLTGEVRKADNKPFTAGGDCGDIQIKSARATICRGTDIKAHIAIDGAKRYGYVNSSFTVMYLMNADEWLEFASLFGTVTRESQKNGGAVKMRLKAEGREMTEWLRARA